MALELVPIGFGNILALDRVVAITGPDSAPIKRLVREGRKKGVCIDMTSGRRTRAVLVLDSGHIVLAALSPESIANRLSSRREEQDV
jgi:hypothetical protein